MTTTTKLSEQIRKRLAMFSISPEDRELVSKVEALETKLEAAREHFLKFPMYSAKSAPELYLEAVKWWGSLGEVLGIEVALGEDENR